MNRRLIPFLLIAVVFLSLFFAPVKLEAQPVPIYGTVTNANGQPVPGVIVSLLHPNLGRSYPSMTDALGRYIQYNIPIHPIPYFIEIYWGYQLIYRGQIQVQAPLQWNIQIR